MNQPLYGVTSVPLVHLPTQALVKAAPMAINAMHPSLPVDTQHELLAMQYRHVTLQDAITSGNAVFDPHKQTWGFRTGRNEPAFKGLVFEAMLARLCRDQPFTVGRKAFAWCTKRPLGRVPDTMISQYVPFVTADRRLLDECSTATFYNPSSPFDVQFYRVNGQGTAELATQATTGAIAGIQVKAIQGNEQTEIIGRVLSGRYPHVLTMLKHPSGEHSYEVCMRILAAMCTTGKITGEQFADAMKRISYPAALNIDQSYIEHYSYFLSLLYTGKARLDQYAAEAIALEVSAQLSPTQSGILMPATPHLILPPTIQ